MVQSLSARRAWIEMWQEHNFNEDCFGSLSARRAWIEMTGAWTTPQYYTVALRKESVDRNSKKIIVFTMGATVALRKESVDRNTRFHLLVSRLGSRSPQGERG